MRQRLNVYFPPALLRQISDLADSRKVSRSAIVEAAVASFLSPDDADRREAAFARRLDRMSRQIMRLERDVGLCAETLALFVRFWLTVTPPIPAEGYAAAQAKGRERFEGFVETLGRRLQSGESFLREIPEDVAGAGEDPAKPGPATDDQGIAPRDAVPAEEAKRQEASDWRGR
ncbi:CopG family transcriptional regulator [Paracoccus denitrificans]|jgi:hypothetical protein|uniref:CopG family transcriptional regulator n=1 Tax=Paracoccus denitrificans (strain Pd 1222) TaxID=318586 RepID=A1B6X6_PARDP|nr:CopG family transcriptional regulator [Paracoccus denitrificans]ABL71270.1 hypothetical protein Pden_3189 [Paracoccus denitrificans PD1222]MBB4629909.1 hypothetical protein [Paracoccus denitrificans]SDJ72791.1 hypothetical protein SAMN04244581_04671 [Paracoccus denitrificans]SFR21550.1 hypothetical protein SAMN04244569_04682 [Paracoccus denitrificans]GEK70916.1 CopG family transcriptional regulator [Paracoccus denitrificans]